MPSCAADSPSIELVTLEPGFLVLTVAERFVVRCAASTQRYSRFVGSHGKLAAVGIDDLDGAFDQKWTIVSHTNRNV